VTPIPFEPQCTVDGSRTCGAAALAMVYGTLGMPSEQLDIWHRVAEEIRPGAKATRTHRLALDALGQGFAAATLQAEQPAELLSCLMETNARVILNHRLEAESHLGHYSVLLRFDGREIELHDPHHGPNRVLPWPDFARLWTPTSAKSEIVGHVLVVVGMPTADRETCTTCGHEPPVHIACPNCSRPIPTGPPGAIRCTTKGCRECHWKRLFCPHCDWAVGPQEGA